MRKLETYIIGGVIAAVALLFASLTFDPWGLRKKAETKAETATQQATVATTTTQALDHVVRSEITVRQEAAGAAEHVEAAQGAETTLPPAFGDAVRAGIDRMRNGSGSGPDHDPGKPASAL